MNNSQVAEVFQNIAGLLEMQGESGFTVRAYQRAARAVDHLSIELSQMVRDEQDLREIPSVGQAIARKIKELVLSGRLEYYESLKAEFPEGILDVMHVPGVGPKTARRLWKELGVTKVSELEEAASSGRVATLPRMGHKMAENILRQLAADRTKATGVSIGRALPAAERVVAALNEACPSISKISIAGSLRRFSETTEGIDLVCAADDPKEVVGALVGLPNVTEVLGRGDVKGSVVLSEGIQVDLRVVEDRQFGTLLAYFTGDVQHAVRIRDHASKMGLSLNEHGLTDIATGCLEEFADEEGLYTRLGLQFIPPELRLGFGEIEAAQRHQIPQLVNVEDIKGDLHLHTDWSDGRDPIEMMVAAARARGYEYVAVTDHSSGRGIANGLSEERLRSHVAALREIEERIEGIRVLCGTEMDIRADGSLDYPDEALAGLDWVIGSVHSAMNQDSARMTERVIRAIHNPHVTVIGHLSTRLIQQRPPIDADFEAIFRAAADTGTVLEINSSPERLDLKDVHVRRARELGVPLVISTDAHKVEALDNTRFGVAVARRGWCEARHILNALDVSDFMSFLRLEKTQRGKAFARHA